MLSRQSYVIVGILALAALIGVTLSHGLQWIWIQLAWDDPYLLDIRELALTRMIGYGVAGAAALFTLKHGPTFGLANEVVDELAKVTWPTREETGSATVMVIVTVLICSAYLGAFDAVWLALTDWVMGIEASPQG